MAKIRKRTQKSPSTSKPQKKSLDFDLLPSTSKKSRKTDDEVLSEDSGNNDDDDENFDSSSSSSEDDVDETVDAKKIRLAREYLSKIERDVDDDNDSDSGSTSSSSADGDLDDDDDDDGETPADPTGLKLARERHKKAGTLERPAADKLREFFVTTSTTTSSSSSSSSPTSIVPAAEVEVEVEDPRARARVWRDDGRVRYFRGHDLTVTCCALSSDGNSAYSGSKDNSVLSWDVEMGRRKDVLVPQWKKTDMRYGRGSGEVLAVAASDDGRFVAVGGRDALVRIFDVRVSSSGGKGMVHEFKGHKGAVTSLAFRRRSFELYSGSDDRCIRTYDLDQMVYVQTLYGHQSPITSLSCHVRDTPVSTARDRTARVWKISHDSHLIFRGGRRTTSADCVAAFKEGWYVTGHEDGDVHLWSSDKKKPVGGIFKTHGEGHCVVCCDALGNSDVGVTGSNDGYLRFWEVKSGYGRDRGIEPLAKIPIHGYVNGVAIGPKAKFCVAAVGQEHRLGRWDRVAKAQNRFAIVNLTPPKDEEDIAGKEEETKEEEESTSGDDSGSESGSDSD